MIEGVDGSLQILALVAALAAAFFAARKAPVERDLIRAEAQGRIIDDLQEEIERYRQSVGAIKEEMITLQKEHEAERKRLEREIQQLRDLNFSHQKRIAALEARNRE